MIAEDESKTLLETFSIMNLKLDFFFSCRYISFVEEVRHHNIVLDKRDTF